MDDNAPAPRLRIYIYAILAVVVIWAFSALLISLFVEQAGQFGDMFGAVNALFSGLAFASLIYTIFLQKHELQLQRKELALTNQELAGQRTQMTNQATTLRLQQFENTFFQLIRTHNNIVNSMDLSNPRNGLLTKGRDCFKIFFERLEADLSHRTGAGASLAQIDTVYRDFYSGVDHEIGHYFRHLFHIIKFVDESDVVDKKKYVTFLRAQLSSFELLLLFYNGLSALGRDKFKPLIEKYGVLKQLPNRGMVNNHRVHYLPAAFLPSSPAQKDLENLGAFSAINWTR